jgi:predicted NAD/FAD-binding protein
LRFFREASISIEGLDFSESLGEYSTARGYSHVFRRHFLTPLAAAVWSMAPGDVDAFPARYFLAFLANHGLIGSHGSGRWRWRTVVGGSRRYVEAIVRALSPAPQLSSPVRSVTRQADSVVLHLEGGAEQVYDAVVIACHADQALALLTDPSAEESAALGAFRYSTNRVVLHTDAAFLPRRSAARASWNYVTADCRRPNASLALTYHLNRLQAIWRGPDFCVSVNPRPDPLPGSIIREETYLHPIYTFATLDGQERVAALQGQRRTFYAGAHLGHGFHEDGFASALRVAHRLGVSW